MQLIHRTMGPYLARLAEQYPVVTVTGPRQSGKTTLCRMVFPGKKYVSLENLDTRLYATEDPRGFLAGLPEGGILDEVQHCPDLLSYIQTVVDTDERKGLYILAGSRQFKGAGTVSQSLAGRTPLLKLLPFSIEELGVERTGTEVDRLLLTGFYPRIWKEQLNPTEALGSYLETHVERDTRQLVAVKDLSLFQRFVTLCAGRIGQLLNFNSLAADTGISRQTASNWLSLLEASYVVFRLPPYFANVGKRLVKSPKLYFYDVGLASYLLGLENTLHVSRDPLRGNLFENMVVMEALKYQLHRGKRSNLYFYRDSNGNEVDLLFSIGPDLFPVEIKAGMTLTTAYFKGLDRFGRLFDLSQGRGLVYGGKEQQQRSGTLVFPAFSVHELIAEMEARFMNSQ
ncbi:MAG: ATP-binding protein [Deltaproteobacteria bacterium]|jgi:predicted AAA+ superfamily ATPase|nr:ATP-binding protein [Deltaproteobacteria bacterium]